MLHAPRTKRHVEVAKQKLSDIVTSTLFARAEAGGATEAVAAAHRIFTQDTNIQCTIAFDLLTSRRLSCGQQWVKA